MQLGELQPACCLEALVARLATFPRGCLVRLHRTGFVIHRPARGSQFDLRQRTRLRRIIFHQRDRLLQMLGRLGPHLEIQFLVAQVSIDPPARRIILNRRGQVSSMLISVASVLVVMQPVVSIA